MLRVFQILSSRFALAASLAALGAAAGCGQRGPLFLPTDVPTNARATLPQTLRPGGVPLPQPAAPAPVPAPVPALSAPALSSDAPAGPLVTPSSASVPP